MKNHKIGLDELIVVLLIWLPLQDLVMGIVYRFTHSLLLANILLYFKDVLLIVLVLLCLFRKPKMTILNKLILVYIMWIAIYIPLTLVISDVSIGTLAASLRGLLLCPLCIFIGNNVVNSGKLLSFYKNEYFEYLLVLAAIGIVEWLVDAVVGTKSFWTDFVGLGALYNDIKNVYSTYNGLPGNFYGYSSAGFFTRKRLVSVWGNPLTSGYSFLVPMVYYFILSFYNKHTKRKYKYLAYVLFFACAIILTYTRAIILGTGISILLLYIYKNRAKMNKLAITFIMFSFVAIVFLFVGDKEGIYQFLYDGSTMSHITHLIVNIARVGFVGSGIGGFGSTESGYLSVWGQLGLIGLVLFVIINYKAISNAFKKVKYLQDIALATAISWITFMITALISEQLTAFTTIAPWYILLGIIQVNTLKRKETSYE